MEQSEIKLFEGKNIRYVWDEEKEQYFFSVVDVIQVLGYWTASPIGYRLLGDEAIRRWDGVPPIG